MRAFLVGYHDIPGKNLECQLPKLVTRVHARDTESG
jgi:hypothetical protein